MSIMSRYVVNIHQTEPLLLAKSFVPLFCPVCLSFNVATETPLNIHSCFHVMLVYRLLSPVLNLKACSSRVNLLAVLSTEPKKGYSVITFLWFQSLPVLACFRGG